MDLGKESRFFALYGECWALMKKYCEPSRWEDFEAYLTEARAIEDKYPEYANYTGACLYHFGRMVENEWKEKHSGKDTKLKNK